MKDLFYFIFIGFYNKIETRYISLYGMFELRQAMTLARSFSDFFQSRCELVPPFSD